MHQVWKDLEGIRMRRAPASEKKICEIVCTDTWVKVIGRVVEVGEKGVFRIEDETGSINVFSDYQTQEVREGDLVRVFGIPLLSGDKREIKAEIVQKMNGLDLSLYFEAKKELEKLRMMV